MFLITKTIHIQKFQQNLFYLYKFKKILHVNISNTNSVDLAYNSYENINTRTNLPPLIVMHGLFGSRKNWRSTCKTLLQKINFSRRIIAVDARNHGESPHSPNHSYECMAGDVVQLLRNQNIKKVAVLGHSMGGLAMMYLTLWQPELVEKGIFVDISPVHESSTLISTMKNTIEAVTKVKIGLNLSFSDARKQAQTELIKLGVDHKPLRDLILTNFEQKSDGSYGWRINADSLYQNFNKLSKFPPDAVNYKYHGPVLFIGGGRSKYISKNDLPKIRQLYFPKANLSIIENAGHLIHYDQPQKFIELVSENLK